ncbi:MAG: hypothetical protein ACI9VN_003857, partial [Patescibacteria group bacterium]
FTAGTYLIELKTDLGVKAQTVVVK